MLSRLNKLWKLSAKPAEVIDSLSVKVIEELLDEVYEPAEFFGEGTIKEMEQQKREDEGTAPWYKRISL